MCPNLKSLLPHEKTGRESGHGFLFQLFLLRSLNYRILKINLEDTAMNFQNSWKRNHKTSDYNQQSVITAECIRPVLKKPDPTSSPSRAFSVEKGCHAIQSKHVLCPYGVKKTQCWALSDQMTDIHRWRAAGSDFHSAPHSTRQILLGKHPPAPGSGLAL